MEGLLEELRAIVGAAHVLQGESLAPLLGDWRGRYHGQALAAVRPDSPAAVAQVVRACARHGAPLVPQGGNTGLCGGATPGDARAIVLLTTRLNRVRDIDTANDTITVEAGCLLKSVQDAAQAAGRLFPLSLAAEGSCTIGGNLATNAGGTQVLRYGNTRDLALGLEVVTPQGEIWHGLRGLRKDNTGYCLRDIYIGSEGTLGIITAATLKLYPQPRAQRTALLALPSLTAAVAVLERARAGFGAGLTAFELMAAITLQAVTHYFPEQRLPFAPDTAPWYALLEFSDSEDEAHAQQRLETVLGAALEAGEAQDAAVAGSVAQSRAFWHLRESIPLAEFRMGKAIKHDIGVPVSRIAAFVETTNAALQAAFPGVRHIIFGHLGDGNLHYNVAPAVGQGEAELLALQLQVYDIVHGSVMAHGGSIAAEHGVGQLKRDLLPRYKDAVEMDLMRRLKAALDPDGLMNPGKVLA